MKRKVHILQLIVALELLDVMAVFRVQKGAEHTGVSWNDLFRIDVFSRE